MPTFQNYLKGIKAEIVENQPVDVKALVDAPDQTVLIDVREQNEYVQGFIPGAHWIPRGFLEIRVEDAVPNRDTPVVLYCAGGTRSALAARSLRELGYTNVKSMAGGFGAWKRSGYRADAGPGGSLLAAHDAPRGR
jgi:rhodanese-related sulfurtransferase